MNIPTMSNEKQSDFGRKVISTLRQVRPYVKHRLYTAETIGIVPRNMYSTSGIIDDAVVKLYESKEGNFKNQKELKLELFKLVSNQVDKLFKKEEFHKYTLSTSQVLEKELELMEEDFTIDIDNDLLMKEDLDDISYRQRQENQHELLYDESEKSIMKTFDLHDERDVFNEDKRKALNKVYSWLPYETSNIVDLLVFGKLKYKEIAKIKDLSTIEVKKSIQAVSNNFRKNLN
jgi:DNA-directed RNA polymerase specialized sigma24 family protein